jgi:hypothetical protein
MLAAGMTLSSGAEEMGVQAAESLTAPTYTNPQMTPPISWAESPVQQLLAFKDSEIKFDLQTLMNILRDGRHEGWVLAAYPDPKTGQPLIGAGLSLDLPERPHPQRDPLNSHPFVEPSSAQLWQAAGLKPEELQRILAEFHDHLAEWDKKGFRKRIKTLPPQITDEDANQLLRVFAIQAVYNAKGYCRNFDQLTASQQMALSQLVYQMGVNLEEFRSFLNLINRDMGAEARAASAAENALSQDWKSVQLSLMESQWARLYRTRAVAVIAMLDPRYSESPATAEHSIAAVLHPVATRRHRGRSSVGLRNASLTGHATRRSRRKTKSVRAD